MFSSCPSTGQRKKKKRAKKQCSKWLDSSGLKGFSLPCVLANIFVWQASGSVDTRSAPQKCCPSWTSSFSLWGVANAMTDWKLFFSARTLPDVSLYHKHWCVLVCSTLWANNCQTFYHRISLWLASNNKLFVHRREEDHLKSCCAANSLEPTMQKVDFQRCL